MHTHIHYILYNYTDAYAVAANSTSFEGPTRQIAYDTVNCNGAETSLTYCSKYSSSSTLDNEPKAAVRCYPSCDCNTTTYA